MQRKKPSTAATKSGMKRQSVPQIRTRMRFIPEANCVDLQCGTKDRNLTILNRKGKQTIGLNVKSGRH